MKQDSNKISIHVDDFIKLPEDQRKFDGGPMVLSSINGARIFVPARIIGI
ncbi:hypothetical protein [Janthinobacterium sp. HH102]|nr:hypothetical protein [Janthinobacterium sp. HH102]